MTITEEKLMSVKLMVDSACDITKKEAEELGILFVPIEVRFNGEEFLDGENLSSEEFYTKLEKSEELPKTSLINSYRWEDEFKKATEDGSSVVVITLSSKLSGTYRAAAEAAEKFDGKVFVVDSMNACIGERLLLLYGLSLKNKGLSAKEIANILDNVKTKINVVAMVGTLKYLKMGGRISAATAFVGEMLSIKPLIAIVDGEVKQVGKAMGVKKAFAMINSIVASKGGIDFEKPYGLVYSGLEQEILNKYLVDGAKLWDSNNKEISKYIIGSTIGTHVGPGAVGIAFFEK